VDLSEGDYGVSLLNDCKYGHDILGQTIRLTLLRSPTSPDPQADQGIHHFTYSLLPHRGGYEQAIPAAYALNDPLMVWRSQASSLDAPADQTCLLHLQPANLVIETIKPAEDGRGFIVRLYDSGRQRGTGKLISTIPLLAAYQTNLLEVDQAALPLQDSTLLFRFKPFQILTLRLIPLS
jgi:alpha-mannosidase